MFDSDDEPQTIYSSGYDTQPTTKGSRAPWIIAAIAIGLGVIVAVAGLAIGLRPSSEQADPVPVPVEVEDAQPETEAELAPETDATGADLGPDPDPVAGSELDCAAAEEESLAMTSEQHTGGPLLVGIGKATVVVDNQVNPPNNGWVLKCEGKGVFSGGPSQMVDFGFQNKAGETYVVMYPR